MKNKKVSVIITTYHGSENLARSILSVLNQTYMNFELIVVDDNEPNSEDRKLTEKVMEKFKKDNIIYLKHPENLNGSAARNTGIKVATGEYIQLLDDDDYLFSNKIELSVDALAKNEDCDFVVCGVIAFGINGVADLSGAYEHSNSFIISKEWLKRLNALGTGSNIFATKKSIESINNFDDSYVRMQDIEFIFRYCEKFKVCSIPEKLIIKALNERPIKLNSYEKHMRIIDKFINQFNNTIFELLSEEEAKAWLIEQYSHLFRIALAEGNKKNISNAKEKLEKYRKLSKSEHLKVKFPKVWIFLKNNSILKKIILQKREGSKVVSNLESKLNQIETIELNVFKEKYFINQ